MSNAPTVIPFAPLSVVYEFINISSPSSADELSAAQSILDLSDDDDDAGLHAATESDMTSPPAYDLYPLSPPYTPAALSHGVHLADRSYPTIPDFHSTPEPSRHAISDDETTLTDVGRQSLRLSMDPSLLPFAPFFDLSCLDALDDLLLTSPTDSFADMCYTSSIRGIPVSSAKLADDDVHAVVDGVPVARAFRPLPPLPSTVSVSASASTDTHSEPVSLSLSSSPRLPGASTPPHSPGTTPPRSLSPPFDAEPILDREFTQGIASPHLRTLAEVMPVWEELPEIDSEEDGSGGNEEAYDESSEGSAEATDAAVHELFAPLSPDIVLPTLHFASPVVAAANADADVETDADTDAYVKVHPSMYAYTFDRPLPDPRYTVHCFPLWAEGVEPRAPERGLARASTRVMNALKGWAGKGCTAVL